MDWLVHQVHRAIADGREDYHRPTAVNLIEGNVTRVTTFLNELAYGPDSTPEVRAEGARWREAELPKLRARFRALRSPPTLGDERPAREGSRRARPPAERRPGEHERGG